MSEAGESLIAEPETEPLDRLRVYLHAVRWHQWLKNLLVFVPPIMAHRMADWSAMGSAVLAFISFSLCASSGYLVNDLLDLKADREHPTKRHRPLAAGQISETTAYRLLAGLFFGSVLVALLLPSLFLGILILYFWFTTAYSWRLKQAAIVDVLVLAGLYTLRIIGGGAASSTPVSFWLLAFSMFLFLSLALVKRYAELTGLADRGGEWLAGRGYGAGDLETLAQFGSTSAFMAVLVLALYINSDAVRDLYGRPEVIWLLCPLVLYLLTRVWLLARRGELEEDPLVFLLRDRRSQGLILLGAALFWLAA